MHVVLDEQKQRERVAECAGSNELFIGWFWFRHWQQQHVLAGRRRNLGRALRVRKGMRDKG